MTSCTDDVMDNSAFLNGKEKTPIAVSLNVDNKTPQSRALSRAVNGSFETNDQLVAYFRHVVSDGNPTPTYTVVNSGKAGTPPLARLVNFKVSALTTGHNGEADNYTTHTASSTLTCKDAQGLYWDDFSEGGKGDNTDLRTDDHYLQSYYGYCYNGSPACGETDSNITTDLVQSTGELGWKVPYDQTTADAVKNADLLWSPTQSPVSYIHENTTANHGVISIPYSHAMCELTVVLKATTGFTTITAPFTSTEVNVNGVNKECSVTAPTVQITGATQGTETGKEGKVNLHGNDYTSGNTRTFYAIFVPGTKIKEGDALLNINDVDGNNYTLTVTSSMLTGTQWGKDHTVNTEDGKNYILTQSGYNYKIEVTVTKQEISAVSTLADWITVETTGTGDIQFTHDDDDLLFEDDSNNGVPGDVSVHAVDKNKFKNNSSFSLFDLKATDANKEASARTNNLYDFVTISTFSNPDDNDTFDDVWVNNPDIYWPNATDNYYFRALAQYNGSTGTGDNKINDISSVGSMTGTVSKGTAVSQGTIAEGHDIIWGTTAKHYGKGKNYESDHTDLRTYEAGQAIPPRTGDVPIAFEHIMSKITFNLATSTGDPTPASAVNLTGAKIYITNLYTSGTVTLDNGNITYTDTNMNSSTELSGAAIKDFYAANEVDGTMTYRLNEYMVIPQPLTEASLVYIVLADGTTYKMILKNCKYQVGEDDDHNPIYEDISKWERGKHYVYTITLEKEKITFRALIKDWEPVKEGSGNATLEWD